MSIRSVKMPRVRVPNIPSGTRNPPGWGTSSISLKAAGLAGASSLRLSEPAGEPPLWWQLQHPSGTKPEWAVYWGLQKNGKLDGQDFIYQAHIPGTGNSRFINVDFLIPDNYIAIEVQGKFWHLGQGTRKIGSDVLRIESLAAQGVKVVFIDEPDALADPIYYVREALQGNDHSHVATGKKNF